MLLYLLLPSLPPYIMGILLFLYLWFSHRSLSFSSLCGFRHSLSLRRISLRRISPFRNSYFQSWDVRRHSNIHVCHFVSIPASADLHLRGCCMGNYSHPFYSDCRLFLCIIWRGNMWPSDVVFKCLDNLSKDIAWIKNQGSRKREKTVQNASDLQLRFCVRSYQMFICVYILFRYNM